MESEKTERERAYEWFESMLEIRADERKTYLSTFLRKVVERRKLEDSLVLALQKITMDLQCCDQVEDLLAKTFEEEWQARSGDIARCKIHIRRHSSGTVEIVEGEIAEITVSMGPDGCPQSQLVFDVREK